MTSSGVTIILNPGSAIGVKVMKKAVSRVWLDMPDATTWFLFQRPIPWKKLNQRPC